MLSVIEHQNLNFVRARAIYKKGGASSLTVQIAGVFQRMGRNFVLNNANGIIGFQENVNGGLKGKRNTTKKSVRFFVSLATCACDVGMMMCGFWRLTTSTQTKSFVPIIECIRRQFASNFGGKKWVIFKFCVPIAIESRLGNNLGSDIACRRIREAYAQPDMLIEAEKATMAKQEALDV